MKLFYSIFTIFIAFTISCTKEKISYRSIEDFNSNWKFELIDEDQASEIAFNDSNWRTINVPHDWSIEQGYKKSTEAKTAASTGFVVGGIGWYRKTFELSSEDKGKFICIKFDGVYNNSKVWINGHFLGFRPNGYSTFSYNLSKHLKYDGSKNTIAVKVDRSAFMDSRWYTGAGIYRKVQLIKTSPIHVKQWGVQITTPKVSKESATITIKTTLENTGNSKLNNTEIHYKILDKSGNTIAQQKNTLNSNVKICNSEIIIQNPLLWSLDATNLLTLKVNVIQNGSIVDNVEETFGIRAIKFDANKGFFLNGESIKLKGVNMHHDVGALGTAATKSDWEHRVKKLKSIGVNAIRMSHNPHSVEFMEVCDEMGMLVMDEFFDEWHREKAKSVAILGDGRGKNTPESDGYSKVFFKWAEKDLKDLIRRDFNHPSVIMWSIGNEIEWTFPEYPKISSQLNNKDYSRKIPHEFDPKTIKKAYEKSFENKIDSMKVVAELLYNWVKDEDTTRPVTCGSVISATSMQYAYSKAVDVFGMNYQANNYDIAHKTYPNKKLVGSENWGSYHEWKSVKERDFVAGMFAWTGFAYLGEAGPWPRKGLEISFFDYTGYKTPRGHFMECLWKEDPKIYMVTTPAKISEFSLDKKQGWNFEMKMRPKPHWGDLRRWEWYTVNEKWNYNNDEQIVVQTYTNCEEAELFLNGKSLGKQKLSDYTETDNIIKWLVPYRKGTLKVVGYNAGKKAQEYSLKTQLEISKIELSSEKTTLAADGYDTTIIRATLLDKNNTIVTDIDKKVKFSVSGAAELIAVDNGWENNIQSHISNKIITHNGRAVLYIKSKKEKGAINITASTNGISTEKLTLKSE